MAYFQHPPNESGCVRGRHESQRQRCFFFDPISLELNNFMPGVMHYDVVFTVTSKTRISYKFM